MSGAPDFMKFDEIYTRKRVRDIKEFLENLPK